MRLVAALGGNALLRRGERVDAEVQLRNLDAAIPALAALAAQEDMLITHGNGPQVGLLALSSPYPLDTLGAETQGMIGYWLVRELGGALPGREVVAILSQTLVDPDDRAFGAPTKFVGPCYTAEQARQLEFERGWRLCPDGAAWRRVVPSPEPVGIIELPVIRRLLDQGVLVVAAGGGGVPVVHEPDGRLRGVEAVVDKDLAAAQLATALDADLLLLLTDVDAVYLEYGTPQALALRRTTPQELRRHRFPAGSMGPKVEAACRFVDATGGRAAIGALSAAMDLVAGSAGTQLTPTDGHGDHADPVPAGGHP